MIQRIGFVLALTCGAIIAPAFAQTPAATPPAPAQTQAAGLSIDSTMGQLRASPGARAILEREMPGIADGAAIPDTMTFRTLAQYAAMEEATLNRINQDLMALPR